MQYSVTPRTQPPTTHQKKQGRHIKGALKLEDNWVIEFFIITPVTVILTWSWGGRGGGKGVYCGDSRCHISQTWIQSFNSQFISRILVTILTEIFLSKKPSTLFSLHAQICLWYQTPIRVMVTYIGRWRKRDYKALNGKRCAGLLTMPNMMVLAKSSLCKRERELVSAIPFNVLVLTVLVFSLLMPNMLVLVL